MVENRLRLNMHQMRFPWQRRLKMTRRVKIQRHNLILRKLRYIKIRRTQCQKMQARRYVVRLMCRIMRRMFVLEQMVPTDEVRNRVVNDEEFDEVVQQDLRIVKQLSADMAEGKPFTEAVSKGQKKRNKKIACCAGQPYHVVNY
ncbi:hypothetical protein QL285_045242 [Trifolium repens]|nr:hypothetical protein QL285_045242 [Trifolium repens]